VIGAAVRRSSAIVRTPVVLTLVVLHVLGWGGLALTVMPAGTISSAAGFGSWGVGIAAYALGMRHAFDADHIAAIDNTTRRFIDRGRPTSTIGFWFSLGHSSVVFLLCAVLALGIGSLRSALSDDGSTLHAITGVWGPTVSSGFLLLIALMNLWTLRRRRGDAGTPSGPLWQILRRFDTLVDRPWRMYLVGFLFGLGFDTATEIGLLALAGSATLGHVPWWAVMTLPLLFAAGMATLDTAQSTLMRRAYGWAPDRPRLARGYGVTMGVLSAAVAVGVATMQVAGVVAEVGGVGPVGGLAAFTSENAGIGLTVVLLGIWAVLFFAVRRPAR
jgi:high-affinity nickel-transport protein